MTLGPSLSLFFLPHSICLGWFALEVEPKIQVIYLGGDIKKQDRNEKEKLKWGVIEPVAAVSDWGSVLLGASGDLGRIPSEWFLQRMEVWDIYPQTSLLLSWVCLIHYPPLPPAAEKMERWKVGTCMGLSSCIEASTQPPLKYQWAKHIWAEHKKQLLLPLSRKE